MLWNGSNSTGNSSSILASVSAQYPVVVVVVVVVTAAMAIVPNTITQQQKQKQAAPGPWLLDYTLYRSLFGKWGVNNLTIPKRT
ncbi:hypothetical protein M0802_002323 [Mischocyttarus mexicanus]|nr:hypothetical protein M0802_002323 [Mischocyttarus mexicanus]